MNRAGGCKDWRLFIMKKRILLLGVLIALVCLSTVNAASGLAAKNKAAKTKKIRISEGDKYTIKIKKGSRISNSNKKVARISKKGVVTGVLKGKCVISIRHRNQTVKYKVFVKSNDAKEKIVKEVHNDNETLQPANGGPESPILKQGYCIEKIEAKDDKSSYIYMGCNPNSQYYNGNSTIKHTVIEIYNDRIKYGVGEYIGFFVNYDATTEVVGDTIYYKSDINKVSLISEQK